jgi:hypothetical protein
MGDDDLDGQIGGYELLSMSDGTLLNTHGPDACIGPDCCIHSPSGHHMREWPLVWVGSNVKMMYRKCKHDRIHPDPDSMAFRLIMHAVGVMGYPPDWHPCCDENCCNAPKVKTRSS